MSRFFKALEQAEQGRARQDQAGRRKADSTGAVSNAPTEQLSAQSGMDPREWSGRQPSVPTLRLEGKNSDGIEPHLVSLLAPRSLEAEQFRTLRYLVEQKRHETGLCMIAVSSPVAGDGKTITSINLAGALAQAPEARVLLVDVDLRHPSVTEHLGLGHSSIRGLVDVIQNPTLSLQDVVKRLPQFNLAVISSGRPPSPPYEVLKTSRLGEIFEEARQRYDYIVLDTPPLVPFPDCRLIASLADGFLVVVTAHKTPQRLVEEAITDVDPARIVGLVFNNDNSPVQGYSYHNSNGQSANGKRKGWLTQPLKKTRNLLAKSKAHSA